MCNVGINIILVHNELSRSCDHCMFTCLLEPIHV